jgi:glutathione S-transferase
MKILEDPTVEHPSYAPPFLKAGDLMIGQTANILQFLGPRLGLVPQSEGERLWAHQLQLTIADWLAEVGSTHHPIANVLYYEDQKPECARRSFYFRTQRIPKFLGYYEKVLAHEAKGGEFLLGKEISYPDLSLFQMIEGLRYAFPRTMASEEPRHPRVVAVRDQVAAQPRIAAYLASPRRLPFNQNGIFRHYPELEESQG